MLLELEEEFPDLRKEWKVGVVVDLKRSEMGVPKM